MIRVGLVQALIPHYREPVFAELASREGIDLTVYADLGARHGSLEGASAVEGYSVIDAKERYVGPVLWDPASVRAARHGFDVLILSWRTRSLLLPHAIRVARKAGTGVVVWGHGASKHDSPMRRRIRMRTAQLADACLLYDPVNAGKLVDAGIPAERVFYAPNAIDQTPIQEARRWWQDRPEELDALQQREGLDPARTVIFISRIEPAKRLEILLEAMKHALARDGEMRLVVVGDGSARKAAEQVAANLGISDSIRFTGAIYDERELAGWCLSAFCFAHSVAVGLSVMHAFGYGLPVVTSNDIDRHGPEINAIRPGENGLLYAEGDPEDFAEQLVSLAESSERQLAMSKAALESVNGENGWSLSNMVDGFEQCIKAAELLRGTR
jgi:glycosyltransferase involved in cell wall biosynthesis